MALFQQSVLKKHLNDLNKEQLQQAWSRFTTQFHDGAKQQNIRNAKEEQYQEGFLRELFVDVLGYTLNPSPGFNLTTEYKNEKDSKKADGAILKAEAVSAVIELKGTDTTDLGKVETQAFSYKNNQKGCTYVITSNFEKLRFYIHDAVDHVEFNLFTLTEKDFSILFCCLQADALLNDTALKMKQASVTVEENVTKQLYADYSGFKRKLFQSIASLNTQYDQLTLFKKTQKLLDRFLFILFAEDRLLVPPNSVREILKDWEHLNEMDNYVPLYDRFKKYFGYLNNGYEGKKYEIFAYNGGLFAADDILDNVKIDDALLYDATKQLSQYDFETEVDVNILGHIFEHSLTEIEEVERELSTAVDATVTPTKEGPAEVSEIGAEQSTKTKTSKRKKDGVFYTPRYITKYIVENTVGALCNAKKEELEITDDAFTPQKRKDNTRKLQQKLETYRQWLLQLTICDPACGSGAFLNQALEFLIAEHRYVDTLTAKLFGDRMVLSDVENSILENNLFGVDINEEAVEIARLSLWLRTARKGRKLNNLSNNIKVGNSLIDDPSVAGDKAFNWENEFAGIIGKGGFDAIIGNPPYVDIKTLPKNIVEYLFNKYKTANNRINLFSVFIEKASHIIKQKGLFSFIIPSALLTQESYKLLRDLLLSQTNISKIVRLPNESFGGGAGEVKVDTIILNFTYKPDSIFPTEVLVYKGFDRITEITPFNTDIFIQINQNDWKEDENSIFRINVKSADSELISKIETNTNRLVDCADFCLGLTPYDKYKGHTPEQITNKVFHATSKIDDTFKKLLAGNDVTRYNVTWNGEEWISYGKWLGAPREQKFFKEKRILVKQIIDWSAKRIWAAMTTDELYNTQNAFNLIAKAGYETEFLLAVLNSKLMSYYHRKKFLEEFKDRFQKILIKDCKEFPIKVTSLENQKLYVDKITLMSLHNGELRELIRTFLSLLTSKFDSLEITKKLQLWQSLSGKDFLKEIEKQKVKLSLSEQSEWMTYFEAEKAKANRLQQLIDATDKEIDRMVYALYELTEEEIKIVEG